MHPFRVLIAAAAMVTVGTIGSSAMAYSSPDQPAVLHLVRGGGGGGHGGGFGGGGHAGGFGGHPGGFRGGYAGGRGWGYRPYGYGYGFGVYPYAYGCLFPDDYLYCGLQG
jgi:hypothetical protein